MYKTTYSTKIDLPESNKNDQNKIGPRVWPLERAGLLFPKVTKNENSFFDPKNVLKWSK